MTDTSITTKTGRLPWAGLFALAVAGFVTVLTQTIPARLLPQISSGLDVPQATGQLVIVYAAGPMLAAIPLTALAQRWPRRPAADVTTASYEKGRAS
ncbi:MULTISPECIES: MFS transporter [unclassified Streptomyces]|uniref:MFS transporter n=1 Tax=unclassified Streptomyces TaxID=2593676 RepID=UPI000DB9131A|nr:MULTISPECIES: MFS transporter [unclassified Streptomyces]MYT68278.1 hypothetical protein [Streptomyces sp. SID8367]RAJ76912.1 hypothetical protein K377_06080 [Streptomyces sp. PsTaAH-137]